MSLGRGRLVGVAMLVLLSTLGDAMMFAIIGISVKNETGSDALAGGVYLAFATSVVLFASHIGRLLDKVPKVWGFAGASVLGILACIPLVLSSSWLAAFASMMLFGIVDVSLSVALATAVAFLFDPSQYVRANGILRSAQESLRVAAPLVGVGLYSLFGLPAVAVADGVSFALVIFLVPIVNRTFDSPTQDSGDSPEIDESNPSDSAVALRERLVLVVAGAMLFIGAGEFLLFKSAEEVLRRSPEVLAFLEPFQGLGAIVAGFLLARHLSGIHPARLVCGALGVFGVGILGLLHGSVAVAAFGMFVAWGAVPVLMTGMVSAIQTYSPKAAVGATIGRSRAKVSGSQLVSLGLGFVLADLVPARLFGFVMVGGIWLVAIVGWSSVRRMHDVAGP